MIAIADRTTIVAIGQVSKVPCTVKNAALGYPELNEYLNEFDPVVIEIKDSFYKIPVADQITIQRSRRFFQMHEHEDEILALWNAKPLTE